ncbi:hypothetical protein A2U01_0034059 [Trifolium medium]|uniref:Endonuclease/exonuclease/phosphatase family protein n=1 Tax=Trifolium medium TaxID=97028 RepID=A0A392PN81_9FABA|nr:hypothetical protein [Trifolium medium]
MKIASFNMRGIGDLAKQRRLQSLLSDGLSGGMLCIWRTGLFKVQFTFSSEGCCEFVNKITPIKELDVWSNRTATNNKRNKQ